MFKEERRRELNALLEIEKMLGCTIVVRPKGGYPIPPADCYYEDEDRVNYCVTRPKNPSPINCDWVRVDPDTKRKVGDLEDLKWVFIKTSEGKWERLSWIDPRLIPLLPNGVWVLVKTVKWPSNCALGLGHNPSTTYHVHAFEDEIDGPTKTHDYRDYWTGYGNVYHYTLASEAFALALKA